MVANLLLSGGVNSGEDLSQLSHLNVHEHARTSALAHTVHACILMLIYVTNVKLVSKKKKDLSSFYFYVIYIYVSLPF